ncbi:MAG: cytochrome P450 [Pseudomonadota bacterium]
MKDAAIFKPPCPTPLSPVLGLMRCIAKGEGDLLSLIPKEAYEVDIGRLGYSRRSIVIVNKPEYTRHIMTDALPLFPKNDLMKGALAPLVGDSVFVSDGPVWERQRRMVEPAFSFIKLGVAFESMLAAVNDFQKKLLQYANKNEVFSLDFSMSHLTADIICRTMFSTSLESDVALDVFESFSIFERKCSNVKLTQLIMGKPWSNVKQPDEVLAACLRIRQRLGLLIDRCIEDPEQREGLARSIIEARDKNNDDAFTREELIDQLGVFFLAGHETTASVLTWAFYIIASQPLIAERIRQEVEEHVGNNSVGFQDIKKLSYTRNVFRETLRLYPPLTFIPRVAAENCEVDGYKIKRGAMVMIAPWTIHRHRHYWQEPDFFDPDRFSEAREHEIKRGSYIPFGQGPRVCAGASFAQIESTLILASIVRAFDFELIEPEHIYPVARLTTRPLNEIECRVHSRTN